VSKDAQKENWKTTQGSRGSTTKQAWWQPEKESTYSFSGNDEEGQFVIIVAADDGEMRTSALQNYATATLCTEEFFLRTQYILYVVLPSY
jgi:hypothetical protein